MGPFYAKRPNRQIRKDRKRSVAKGRGSGAAAEGRGVFVCRGWRGKCSNTDCGDGCMALNILETTESHTSDGQMVGYVDYTFKGKIIKGEET